MNRLINEILLEFKPVLKQDFEVYRNHVYRIYSFMILLDNDKTNYDKYAIACVFHDIGIWTHSFDYLEPSIELAKEYLIKSKRENWISEISLMINYHHKMSAYKGAFETTVEVFRKADWIDVSIGIMLFNLKKTEYKYILNKYSNSGFHIFLIKQSSKYFLKNPFNPLPMFLR